MSEAMFSDHLLAGTGITDGAGLKGFVDGPFWMYARHDWDCKPGKWLVRLCTGSGSDEFWNWSEQADAVVDDFGNLRRVATQGEAR